MQKNGKASNDGSTAVRKVAKALRAVSLNSEPGAFLGSEEDLFTTHKVSRPTFRQAAALLAQEQVLIIKRGVGGGYFSSRPKAEAVTHTAAIFLQGKGTTLQEIMRAIVPIWIELSKAATLSGNEVARERLRQFAHEDAGRSMAHLAEGTFDVEEYVAYLRSEREFASLVEELSENTVLALFLEILNDFCANLPRAQDIFRRNPVRVFEYSEMRRRVMEAIIDRDEQIAAVQAERCAKTQISWLTEDSLDNAGAKKDFATALDFSARTVASEEHPRGRRPRLANPRAGGGH
ncbi:MAG: transcriptional regulator [Caulobacter sp.]|nr:transcriptional regulator [Caulobacter sp.]